MVVVVVVIGLMEPGLKRYYSSHGKHNYLIEKTCWNEVCIKPGFHYKANATITTQKQSDYRVEQSSFMLIALFSLKIGRCRGCNWLNGNQALSQLRPRQQPISGQNKAISVKDDCSTL